MWLDFFLMFGGLYNQFIRNLKRKCLKSQNIRAGYKLSQLKILKHALHNAAKNLLNPKIKEKVALQTVDAVLSLYNESNPIKNVDAQTKILYLQCEYIIATKIKNDYIYTVIPFLVLTQTTKLIQC